MLSSIILDNLKVNEVMLCPLFPNILFMCGTETAYHGYDGNGERLNWLKSSFFIYYPTSLTSNFYHFPMSAISSDSSNRKTESNWLLEGGQLSSATVVLQKNLIFWKLIGPLQRLHFCFIWGYLNWYSCTEKGVEFDSLNGPFSSRKMMKSSWETLRLMLAILEEHWDGFLHLITYWEDGICF